MCNGWEGEEGLAPPTLPPEVSAKAREELHKGIAVGGAKKGRFLVTKMKMSQAIVDHCNNDLGHSFYITPLASQLMCSQDTKQNKNCSLKLNLFLP